MYEILCSFHLRRLFQSSFTIMRAARDKQDISYQRGQVADWCSSVYLRKTFNTGGGWGLEIWLLTQK